MSAKKTTTTDQNTHSVQTPNVPDWGVSSLKDLNGRINALGQVDPQSYVAPPNALQNQAFAGAGNLGGWQPGNTAASGIAQRLAGSAAPQATSAGIFDNGIGQYLNPFLTNVVRSSLSDFDTNAAQTRAAQEASGAGSGAFAGSRFGLMQGETEGQLARARSALESGLLSQGYDSATALAGQDAARRQSTSQFNATSQGDQQTRSLADALAMGQLSDQAATNQRADVNTQASVGGAQRDIAQSQATAPIALAQTIASLLQGNQLGLLTGQTTDASGRSKSTTSTSDPMGTIGSLLQMGASIAGAPFTGGASLAGLFSGAGGIASGGKAA